MKFTEKTVAQDPMILANDHYVAVPYDCSEIETDSGIIPAGTILPANDENARGVLLHTVDKNDDPNGALVIHGFVAADRLPEAPGADTVAALGQITFIPFIEAETDGNSDTDPDPDPDGNEDQTQGAG